MQIQMSADQNTHGKQTDKDENEEQHFQHCAANFFPRSGGLQTAVYFGGRFGKRPSLIQDHGNSIGLRARGSRSFVVAVLGDVTNGPPSSGAAEENATSGMSLGNPSKGNSFRSGK